MPLTEDEKVIEIFTRVLYNTLYEHFNEVMDKEGSLTPADLLYGFMSSIKKVHSGIEDKVTNETINHEANYPKGSNVIQFRPRKSK